MVKTMEAEKLQEIFNLINRELATNHATLSEVRMISVQLQDMVENYKLQAAIKDFQEFLLENKIITKEQIEEYIKNKKNNMESQN